MDMSVFLTELAMEVHKAVLVRTVADGASRWVWAVIRKVAVLTIDYRV